MRVTSVRSSAPVTTSVPAAGALLDVAATRAAAADALAQAFRINGDLGGVLDLLPARLADSKEAVEQIAFADIIILNKMDLVTEAEAVEVTFKREEPQEDEVKVRATCPGGDPHFAVEGDRSED